MASSDVTFPVKGTDSAKIANIFRTRFFVRLNLTNDRKHSLKSTLQIGIEKNFICQREVCLPAAEAFAFSSPDLSNSCHTAFFACTRTSR